MFFLIRMAFWLALILLILPIGLTSDGGRQVGAWQALSAVQAAIADARGFCQRQPDACAVGGEMLGHLTDKAQAGAKWVYDTIGTPKGEHGKADAQAAPAEPARQNAGKDGEASHDLTPQDLAPAWAVEPARAAPPAAPGMPLPPRRPA
ncbi:DUF5330 domain-containing protein [Azorhizobium doebereinerae]|uniref:DUF5330 domain-containing protein n=1 Tax=Azorhizobium doebereinerae TaxID=281091 RepID=UPI0003FB1EEF|nr:DUF5330 domain-containing protein [Azorhizobium doebereinerae]